MGQAQSPSRRKGGPFVGASDRGRSGSFWRSRPPRPRPAGMSSGGRGVPHLLHSMRRAKFMLEHLGRVRLSARRGPGGRRKGLTRGSGTASRPRKIDSCLLRCLCRLAQGRLVQGRRPSHRHGPKICRIHDRLHLHHIRRNLLPSWESRCHGRNRRGHPLEEHFARSRRGHHTHHHHGHHFTAKAGSSTAAATSAAAEIGESSSQSHLSGGGGDSDTDKLTTASASISDSNIVFETKIRIIDILQVYSTLQITQ